MWRHVLDIIYKADTVAFQWIVALLTVFEIYAIFFDNLDVQKSICNSDITRQWLHKVLILKT